MAEHRRPERQRHARHLHGTGRLDKLERAGLLRRSPDPHDRRALQVTLTNRGLAMIDEAVQAGLALQTEALSALDEEQVGQLADLLRHLLAGTVSPQP